MSGTLESKVRYLSRTGNVFWVIWCTGGLLAVPMLIRDFDDRFQALLIPHLSVSVAGSVVAVLFGRTTLRSRRAVHALAAMWTVMVVPAVHILEFSLFGFCIAKALGNTSLSLLVAGGAGVSAGLFGLLGWISGPRMWNDYIAAGAIDLDKAQVHTEKAPQAGSPLWYAIIASAAVLAPVLGTLSARAIGEGAAGIIFGALALAVGLLMLALLGARFGLLIKMIRWERSTGRKLKF